MKATALAHPNIALVKYWGKRDDALILPHQSSLSLTLSPLSVTTTVEFGAASDQVELNGHTAKGSERDRVLRLLELVRTQAKADLGPAKVVSRGDFPMAAGLASSAAGFAALAVAGRAAAGLPSEPRAASILARMGSGSAQPSPAVSQGAADGRVMRPVDASATAADVSNTEPGCFILLKSRWMRPGASWHRRCRSLTQVR
nr:hypothetical protein [Myxococcus sp. AB056]